jgi:bidirectional [NiFe] hydrogenase diaphorase subunit
MTQSVTSAARTVAQLATAVPVATNTITLTVNGELVTAKQGDTLLDIFREQNVAMPTLCEFEGLTCIGACRLCLAEIVGRPKLAAACVTAAEEGMEVRTDSEKLQRYRQLTIELLFAERNHVCAVCVMNGHCELQDMAAANGVDHIEFDYLHPELDVDISHPRFGIDHNRCVLCTRCVRVCDQIEGAHSWDVGGRGVKSLIVSDMAGPWGESVTCTSCGKCVQICPTGALFEKGATVMEMVKNKDKLRFLSAARHERTWLLDMVVNRTRAANGLETAAPAATPGVAPAAPTPTATASPAAATKQGGA